VTVSLRVNTADYGSLSRALKRAEPTIRKNMRREIGKAARPVVAKAREQIRAGGGVPSEFRAAVAAKVRLVQRDSPKRTQVAITGASGAAGLPDAARKLNRTGSFRHPVYGTGKWVSQSGPDDWFDGPFKEASAEVAQAVRTAMDRAFAELSRIR